MKIELKNLKVEKVWSPEISKLGKVEVWNHDYNPWLISNNPDAVVLNDHWIPIIIKDHWSRKS